MMVMEELVASRLLLTEAIDLARKDVRRGVLGVLVREARNKLDSVLSKMEN